MDLVDNCLAATIVLVSNDGLNVGLFAYLEELARVQKSGTLSEAFQGQHVQPEMLQIDDIAARERFWLLQMVGVLQDVLFNGEQFNPPLAKLDSGTLTLYPF
jgi:hypothetical protein